MIKDLPLNEVSNKEVLDVFKMLAPVASPVKYNNIWLDGHCMHLCNGDQFLYIPKEHIASLPMTMMVQDMKVRIFKPVIYSRCSRCHETGHHASSNDCPAQAPPEVQSSVEAFQGSRNPLSNLYMCPEGCKWDTADNVEVPSSEHEYQYEKLSEHGKADKAD